MTTRRNSGGQTVRNDVLKDLNQFDRQLENTINTNNTISTEKVKGLDPVVVLVWEMSFFFFFLKNYLFSLISVNFGQKGDYYTIERLRLWKREKKTTYEKIWENLEGNSNQWTSSKEITNPRSSTQTVRPYIRHKSEVFVTLVIGKTF